MVISDKFCLLFSKEKRQQIISHKSYLWEQCQIYKLTSKMRVQCVAGEEISTCNGINFIHWLLKIRNQELHSDLANEDNDLMEISEHMLINLESYITIIIDVTYMNFQLKYVVVQNWPSSRCWHVSVQLSPRCPQLSVLSYKLRHPEPPRSYLMFWRRHPPESMQFKIPDFTTN